MKTWTKTEIKETLAGLLRLLSERGIKTECGGLFESDDGPKPGHVQYPITVERGLIWIAGIYFLEDGALGCKTRGFYFEDTDLAKIADCIADIDPGRKGDTAAFAFRRLECRSNSQRRRPEKRVNTQPRHPERR